MSLAGTIGNQDFRDFSGLDLDLTITGRRPRLLLSWTELPLPNITRFALSGRLHGTPEVPHRLLLEGLEMRIAGDDYEASLAGDVTDLATIDGLDLKFEVSGAAVERLGDWFDWPDLLTRSYTVAGRLTGSRDQLGMTDIAADIQVPEGRLAVSGAIGDLLRGRELELETRLEVTQIAGLARRLGFELPDLDAAEIPRHPPRRLGATGPRDRRVPAGRRQYHGGRPRRDRRSAALAGGSTSVST